MTELVIAVCFAIVISAGCSLFEAVLYSVPKRHIEAMAQKGKTAGLIFKRMRDRVDRPIAAILSMNTIANTAGAAFAGSAATAVFGGPRMGPIFGGMLLSGKKVAELVMAKIRTCVNLNKY